MKVDCDKCHGTGELEIEETVCPAAITVGHEMITCYGEDRHHGEPHMAILSAPCAACGGYDEHHDSCGVYDMEQIHGATWETRWYSWRDGDTALTQVEHEVGQQWRDRHQPGSPHARRTEGAAA